MCYRILKKKGDMIEERILTTMDSQRQVVRIFSFSIPFDFMKKVLFLKSCACFLLRIFVSCVPLHFFKISIQIRYFKQSSVVVVSPQALVVVSPQGLVVDITVTNFILHLVEVLPFYTLAI